MSERKFETTAAFKELIDLVRDSDALFLAGPRAVDDVPVATAHRPGLQRGQIGARARF